MAVGKHAQRVLEQTADLAASYTLQNAMMMLKSLRGGRDCFIPIVKKDKIGIQIAQPYGYLVYQNDGFASYTMTSLAGKTIPMIIGGKLVFRVCSGKTFNQFRSGTKTYWHRDINGDLYSETSQARAWVHPGLGPKNFIEQGVSDAIKYKQQEINQAVMRDLRERDKQKRPPGQRR